MKNMIYLYDTTFYNQPGIHKKVLMQTKAFCGLGYNSYIISERNNAVEILNYSDNEYSYIFFDNKKDYYEKIFDFIKNVNPQVIYIRKQYLLNYFVMNFYKKISNEFTNSKIILEIPTYPYDSEIEGAALEKYLPIDRHYRTFLSLYFKYLTNYNGFDEIFNIKAVKLYNGIDSDLIRIKNVLPKKDKTINLFSATSMAFWNGFERLLKGLSNYYNQPDRDYTVYFHIAGEGSELYYYKRLTDELRLNSYVIFHGKQTGDALDRLYDMTDIGVLSLALYKIMTGVSSIRAGEFMAKGIPIIYAGGLSFNDFPYKLEFENDETDININRIVDFYNNIKDIKNLQQEIRSFAIENFEWKMLIKKLLDTIS